MVCPEELTSLTEVTIAEILARWPETIPVFVRHRLACVGCVIARFERVPDAAQIYGFALEPFVAELQQAIAARKESTDSR